MIPTIRRVRIQHADPMKSQDTSPKDGQGQCFLRGCRRAQSLRAIFWRTIGCESIRRSCPIFYPADQKPPEYRRLFRDEFKTFSVPDGHPNKPHSIRPKAENMPRLNINSTIKRKILLNSLAPNASYSESVPAIAVISPSFALVVCDKVDMVEFQHIIRVRFFRPAHNHWNDRHADIGSSCYSALNCIGGDNNLFNRQ